MFSVSLSVSLRRRECLPVLLLVARWQLLCVGTLPRSQSPLSLLSRVAPLQPSQPLPDRSNFRGLGPSLSRQLVRSAYWELGWQYIIELYYQKSLCIKHHPTKYFISRQSENISGILVQIFHRILLLQIIILVDGLEDNLIVPGSFDPL